MIPFSLSIFVFPPFSSSLIPRYWLWDPCTDLWDPDTNLWNPDPGLWDPDTVLLDPHPSLQDPYLGLQDPHPDLKDLDPGLHRSWSKSPSLDLMALIRVSIIQSLVSGIHILDSRMDGWTDGPICRSSSPLEPLPWSPSTSLTNNNQGTGIADHVLPLGCYYFFPLHHQGTFSNRILRRPPKHVYPELFDSFPYNLLCLLPHIVCNYNMSEKKRKIQ